MNEPKPLCCQNLANFWLDPESPLQYEPEKRRVRIYSIPPAYRKKRQPLIVYDLFYCPKCGKEFPEDLAKEWADEIREKYGVYNVVDKKQLSKLPEEFLSDMWWRQKDKDLS